MQIAVAYVCLVSFPASKYHSYPGFAWRRLAEKRKATVLDRSSPVQVQLGSADGYGDGCAGTEQSEVQHDTALCRGLEAE